jgi:hypothetical protein
MKRQQPIRVIPSKRRGHKTEQRVFAREIHESFCAQRGCKFYGQHSVQGVCHTRDTFAGGIDWRYIDLVARHAQERAAAETKMVLKGKTLRQKLVYMQHMAEFYYMNDAFMLDNLVRLRRENALLRHRIGMLP